MNLEYRTARDRKKLINLRPLVIYIFLNEHEYCNISDEIRRINHYVDFTRNLFRIEPIYRKQDKPNLENNVHLLRSIRHHNLWMRLIDEGNEHCYIFGYLNTSPSYIREHLYKYITLFCEVNISYIESSLHRAEKDGDRELITKLQSLKQCFEEARDQKRTPGLARWKSSLKRWEEYSRLKTSFSRKVRTQNKEWRSINEEIGTTYKELGDFNICSNHSLDISHKEIPRPKTPSSRVKKIQRTILSFDKYERQELWEYMRFLCGDFPDEQASRSTVEELFDPNLAKAQKKANPNVQVEIKKIKSKRCKYGVEILVDNHTYPIYIGPINERMAYIATLLRHKTNNYLYHHEFHNSFMYNSKRIFTQRTSYNWLQSLYAIIEPTKKVDFGVWIAKFKRDNGRAIHQAISNIRRSISDILNEDAYAAIPYVVPTTSHDAIGDSYYMVKIDSDNIIVAEELRDLVDNFYKYYE